MGATLASASSTSVETRSAPRPDRAATSASRESGSPGRGGIPRVRRSSVCARAGSETDVSMGTAAFALMALEDTLAPVQASVSLDGGTTERGLRCTLGARATPDDPDGRQAIRASLELLGTGPLSEAADDALTHAARGAPKRRYVRAIALRARPDRVRPRVGSWIGGDTVGERCARITDALRALGLDAAADRTQASPTCSLPTRFRPRSVWTGARPGPGRNRRGQDLLRVRVGRSPTRPRARPHRAGARTAGCHPTL